MLGWLSICTESVKPSILLESVRGIRCCYKVSIYGISERFFSVIKCFSQVVVNGQSSESHVIKAISSVLQFFCFLLTICSRHPQIISKHIYLWFHSLLLLWELLSSRWRRHDRVNSQPATSGSRGSYGRL